MILINIAGAAAAALTATLSVSSARNMIQTFHQASLDSSTPSFFEPGASAAETVERLRACNRKQLLQIYLHDSETPAADFDELSQKMKGNWDAVQLDNGLVLVSVFVPFCFWGGGDTIRLPLP